jgi:hypothetical protein
MVSIANGENKPTQLLGGWVSLRLQKKIRGSKKRNYCVWFFRKHWNMSRPHRNRLILFHLLLKTETDAFSETSCFLFRPETMDSVCDVSHLRYTLIFAWTILQQIPTVTCFGAHRERIHTSETQSNRLNSACVIMLDRVAWSPRPRTGD